MTSARIISGKPMFRVHQINSYTTVDLLLRYRVLARQAAAAVTNAVVTSASKGSRNPLCRREIGRKKLAVHKRSGSHGWIPRWQYSERLPGVPFLKDLLSSPSPLPLPHAPSFTPRLASPSFLLFFFSFHLALFYERRYRHLVFDYREGILVRGWGRIREHATTSRGFIRVLLDGRCTYRRRFFLIFSTTATLLS